MRIDRSSRDDYLLDQQIRHAKERGERVTVILRPGDTTREFRACAWAMADEIVRVDESGSFKAWVMRDYMGRPA